MYSITKPRTLLKRKFVWKLVFSCSNTSWKWNLGRIDSILVWILVTSCENQQLNFALWKSGHVCLSERLQPDVRARIIRCTAQMEWFDFFFALHLGEHHYYHTDNLSKDLQGTKMAAVSGQRLANLTKGTLTKICIDQSFDHFYANVARKSEGLLGEPTLPRKRHTSARLEVGAGAPSYPQTARDHFVRPIIRLFILSSGLSISALIRKASPLKPRWRPSCLKLL